MEVMTKKITFEEAKEILTEYLSESPSKRKGKKKYLVLKEIFDLRQPFKIKELVDMSFINHSVSQETVYRAVRLFTKIKILIRSPLKENEPLCSNKYELKDI